MKIVVSSIALSLDDEQCYSLLRRSVWAYKSPDITI